MATYQIPRNYGGETRILYIFSIKSLITTAIGGSIGFCFYSVFKFMALEKVAIGFLAFFALVGFGIGALKIPTIPWIPVTKKIGGEDITEIIFRYIKFKRTKKIYIYTKEED